MWSARELPRRPNAPQMLGGAGALNKQGRSGRAGTRRRRPTPWMHVFLCHHPNTGLHHARVAAGLPERPQEGRRPSGLGWFLNSGLLLCFRFSTVYLPVCAGRFLRKPGPAKLLRRPAWRTFWAGKTAWTSSCAFDPPPPPHHHHRKTCLRGFGGDRGSASRNKKPRGTQDHSTHSYLVPPSLTFPPGKGKTKPNRPSSGTLEEIGGVNPPPPRIPYLAREPAWYRVWRVWWW